MLNRKGISTVTKAKESKFKYAINFKSLMEVPVIVKTPPPTSDFERISRTSNSNSLGKSHSNISQTKPRSKTSTNERIQPKVKEEIPLKPFVTRKINYNQEKPINYSELYKDGYLARKTGKYTGKNKSADNYTTADRLFTKNLNAMNLNHSNLNNNNNNNIRGPTKSKSEPDLSLDLSVLLNRHDERFRNFVKLMERYNEEKLRLEQLKINGGQTKKKNESLFKQIIRKIFRIKDNSINEKKEEISEYEEEIDTDPEFQNFVNLMQRHEDSYKNFQKLVTIVPEEDPNAVDNSKIRALRLKHLEMTNLIKSDVDMLEV